jgi:HEAT repeat protein
MAAMDKPNLDFTTDEESHHLWLYGAEVLGDLKATEALDLLISHLTTRTATFSTSMNHQPALGGVIKMGSIAIPKLSAVLNDSPDPKMRYSAVYCMATIGGPTAVQSLEHALRTESDKCVSRLIRISLDSFDEAGNIKDRGEWFSGISCDQ